MATIRLSASRLKSLKQCSWKFWLNEVIKLPEATHPKTIVGSIAHSILEALKKQRHYKHYMMIIGKYDDGSGFLGPEAIPSIYNSPAVDRLVKFWLVKNPTVTAELIESLDKMVLLVLEETNFFDDGATKVFDPEHEFLFKIDGKYEIKGFLDKLAIYGPKGLITDYKTQGKKFTQDELDENIQAAIYQMYVYKFFGVPADVEFVMLRHPPKGKDLKKHIQVVPAKTPAELRGIEIYLMHMGKIFQDFTIEYARNNILGNDPDARKHGFCNYVCQFKDPFAYQSILDFEGKLVKNCGMDQTIELKQGESIEIRQHKGCPAFHHD